MINKPTFPQVPLILPPKIECDMDDCSNLEHKRPIRAYRKRRILTIFEEMSDAEHKRAVRMHRETYNNKLLPMFELFCPPVGKKATSHAVQPDEKLKFCLFYLCSGLKG